MSRVLVKLRMNKAALLMKAFFFFLPLVIVYLKIQEVDLNDAKVERASVEEPIQQKAPPVQVNKTAQEPQHEAKVLPGVVKVVEKPLQDGPLPVQFNHSQVVKTTHPAKKLFLFAYMRGGSSILGEMFNQNPQGTYWYEPWDAIYSSLYGTDYWYVPLLITHDWTGVTRKIPNEEHELLARHSHAIMNCDITNIPTEVLTHMNLARSVNLLPYQKCYQKGQKKKNSRKCKKPLSQICPKTIAAQPKGCMGIISEIHAAKSMGQGPDAMNQIGTKYGLTQDQLNLFLAHEHCLQIERRDVNRCIDKLQDQCKRTTLFSAKILRATMDAMIPVFKETPDIKVIHYVRDPRGTLLSRRKVGLAWPASKDIVAEAKVLCSKMVHDLQVRKQLEKIYPGKFLQVKYEDLAVNPYEITEQMYGHVDLKVPSAVNQWIEKNMNVKKPSVKTRMGFGTSRVNSTATAYAWRTKLTQPIGSKIDKVCSELYKELGYEPMY